MRHHSGGLAQCRQFGFRRVKGGAADRYNPWRGLSQLHSAAAGGAVVIVLGLDPGSLHTGYGVIDVRGSALRALDFGRLSCPRTAPLAQRLALLCTGLERILDRWAPEAAAVEAPFHGRNSRSLIVLAEARGALLATLSRRGLVPAEMSPAQVKAAVVGYGRAEKAQVATMVRLLLGLRDRLPTADSADALAVAICYSQHSRTLNRLAIEDR